MAAGCKTSSLLPPSWRTTLALHELPSRKLWTQYGRGHQHRRARPSIETNRPPWESALDRVEQQDTTRPHLCAPSPLSLSMAGVSS